MKFLLLNKLSFKHILHYLGIVTILINVYIASWFVLHGDIQFWPDNARDMLLMEDIMTRDFISLIGPRSGGIPGVFHGPLWTYINLPAYFIGNGNPAYLGIFWVLLFLISLFGAYWITKKMFDASTAIITTLLFSFIFRSNVASLFNPYGAVMCFPLFFYFIVRYFEKPKIVFITIALFFLGIIIQFQMAFGIPLLVLTTALLITYIFKQKKYNHFFAFLVFIIPLSTFMVFELRHDFLQINSVLQYITKNKSATTFNFIGQRLYLAFTDGLAASEWWRAILILGVIIWATIQDKKNQTKYKLFLYFFVGYWLITLLYKGQMWVFYYWPLLTVAMMFFAASLRKLNIKYASVILLIFAVPFIRGTITWFGEDHSKVLGNSIVSWKFYKSTAEKMYSDSSDDFGYYIFSDDELGYQPRYALRYIQKKYPDKTSYSNQKKREVYTFIFPVKYSFLDKDWWLANRVKITKKPSETFMYENGVVINKYILTKDEQSIMSDPNLIDSLIFR